MLEILKTAILDFQENQLNTGVLRRLEVETVPGKATVYMGVRRSGKSTFLYQIVQRLLDSGVSRQNILFLNFFDDRFHNLQQEGLSCVTEAYYSLYPEKKNAEKVFCFFDEIQVIDNWESYVDRLIRTEDCEVYITGSSAKMLSKEMATQMRGRALSWEIFPFSFREYLDYQGHAVTKHLSTKKRLVVQKAFEHFWRTGGFPEVAGLDSHLRVKTHQEYLHAILFRDLIERHDVSHPKAVLDLAYRLVDNTASLYTVNRLTSYLKSLGHKVPKAVVSNYIQWFEDAYFLFTVGVFDASLARRNTNPKKIYCIDHAFVTSVTSGILVNSGHLLENMVFVALRRCFPEIFYYKTQSGREVDFCVQDKGHSLKLVQVCESLADESTYKREVAALEEAMIEQRQNFATIVTRNEQQQIVVDTGEIKVVPIWEFLLGS